MLGDFTPSAQKGPKKTPRYFARGTKHYAQLKSNKKISRVFFRAFLGRGRDFIVGFGGLACSACRLVAVCR
jgi:hypothetical protein